ncbi:lysylphosphatidylglycerol synthase domain-containing protein [Aeromicrobium sp. JJY06]|uniref:lysylphosphatidylglycerol synthase domain-containing protein n=1 Tax=Aeromicrobium sp. JJY06 TaxID=3373478 RepID=UPI00376F07B7
MSPSTAEPRRRWLRFAVTVGLTLLVLVVGISLADEIDWEGVRSSLARLEAWQLAVLCLGLLLRQWLNALPLALFIEGLSSWRAMQNDQAAILMTTVAPPPADYVMRFAIFTSWGIALPAAVAGSVMNTLSFYVVRFGAPVLGSLLMILLGTFHLGELLGALPSMLVSVAILGALWLAFRGEAFTAALARRAGDLVARVRPKVSGEAWAESAAGFRRQVIGRVPRALPRSLLALTAMVLVDATLLVASLRFVGVDAQQVPAIEVVVAFLVAYPLTLFPFSGIGILDAVVIATLLSVGTDVYEEGVIAGFFVWRIVTIGGPILLGLLSVALWKWELLRRPTTPAA